MLTSLVLALLLSTPEADAAAELQLRAAGPVVLIVDGRPAPMMANLKMRAGDLAPGSHDVRITGMFGKTLYEGQVELADGMITHAEWESRELRIVKTEPLGERAAPAWPWQDDAVAEAEALGGTPDEAEAEEIDGTPDEAEAEEIDGTPDEAEAEEVDGTPDEAEAEEPVAEVEVGADEPVADPVADAQRLVTVVEPPAGSGGPLAIPVGQGAEPVEAAASLQAGAPSPAGPASSRTLTLEMREGMAVNVVHGDNAVRLTVRDGALVVEDEAGMTLTLE